MAALRHPSEAPAAAALSPAETPIQWLSPPTQSTPLSVPELARQANMSPSTFHQHFKAITETTPLQYQKQLRLLEARRLLADGDRSVSDTAHVVGYRSATQFSREYARTFGIAPRETTRIAAAQI